MRRLIRYGIALWAYTYGISTLQAQNSVTIKLEQAIELGIKNNSALKLSGAKVQLAENRIFQIKERLLPSARATASFSQYNLITLFSLQPEGGSKASGYHWQRKL